MFFLRNMIVSRMLNAKAHPFLPYIDAADSKLHHHSQRQRGIWFLVIICWLQKTFFWANRAIFIWSSDWAHPILGESFCGENMCGIVIGIVSKHFLADPNVNKQTLFVFLVLHGFSLFSPRKKTYFPNWQKCLCIMLFEEDSIMMRENGWVNMSKSILNMFACKLVQTIGTNWKTWKSYTFQFTYQHLKRNSKTNTLAHCRHTPMIQTLF